MLSSENSVETTNLRKVYFQKKTEALKGLDFQVIERSIVAVVGPNGAGKSTLQNLLCLNDRRTSGGLVLMGQRHRQTGQIEKIGIVPQTNLFWDTLTVNENLKLITDIKGYSPLRAEDLI